MIKYIIEFDPELLINSKTEEVNQIYGHIRKLLLSDKPEVIGINSHIHIYAIDVDEDDNETRIEKRIKIVEDLMKEYPNENN